MNFIVIANEVIHSLYTMITDYLETSFYETVTFGQPLAPKGN